LKFNRYGLEITSFALPWILDGNWETLLKSYKLALKDFDNEISVHGVFMDMITVSRDDKILGIVRERIINDINIAEQLGAKIVTFCSCFNPSIAMSATGYVEGYKQRQIKFWTQILDSITNNQITLVFENLWDPKPELVKDIIDGVNNEKFKALLDTGHVNIYSQVPIERWVETLADHLAYVHLNDNNQDSDSNLAPGDGNINWNEFFNALGAYGLKPRICLEVEAYGNRSKLENIKRSIEYLKKMKFYPFEN
jgi:sugar phosphate isomerase/epimerase